MAEFDDKLNSLLSNPEAMDQIMKMAQSLMGGETGSGGTVPETGQNPPGPPPDGENRGNSAPGGVSPGASSGGAPGWGQPGGSAPFPETGRIPFSGGPSGPDLSFLSGLGGIDPQTVAALLPVLRELGGSQDSNARQLLFALRPYLKPERQDKVERALQLARLFRVGKKFLLKGDGHV